MVQIKAIDKFGEIFVGDSIVYHNISDNPEREFVVACLKVNSKFSGGGYSLKPLMEIAELNIDGERFTNEQYKKI